MIKPHSPSKHLLDQNICISFCLAFALILTFCFLFFSNVQYFVERHRWVEHTHQVVEEIQEAASALKDAGTAARSFALTGDELFISSYNQTLEDTNAHFVTVKQLTSDNARQQQRLAELLPLVQTRIDAQKLLIEERQNGNLTLEQNLDSIKNAKPDIDKIWRLTDEMKQEELDLLNQRTEQMQFSRRSAILTFCVFFIVVSILFFINFLFIRRNNKRREQVESEQARLLAVLESSSDFIGIADRPDQVVYLNSAGRKLFQLDETSAIEIDAVRNAHPQWALELIRTEGIPTAEREGRWLGEAALFDANKNEIPVSLLITAHKKQTGEIDFYSMVSRTIAAQKKIEQALQESERRYRNLVDKSLGLICTHTLDGTILSVNEAGARALGYASNEMIGCSIKDFISPQTRHLFELYLGQMKTAGESTGFLFVCDKNGDEKIWHYNNVLCEGGGDCYVLGYAQDVTELKHTENALRESRQLFQQFMNNSPAMSFMKARDGKYVFVNEPFEQMFNVNLTELRGKTDFHLFSPEISNELRANDLMVLETGETLSAIEMVPTPNGVERFWQSYKFLVTNEHEQKFVGGVAFDVTESKRLEAELEQARDAALKSARVKAEFLANMSHEIRTPMNGVIGMTDLLLSTDLNHEQQDYAGTIKGSAHLLLKVINDILDFSKIEAGKLNFETVDFDLQTVVEETVELFAEQAQNKQLELVSLVEAAVPRALRGDPGRLRQIFTNLIGNALKFTDYGEVSMHVSIERETDEDVCLRFKISDTGIGIHAEAQKNLFQAFIQADGSTTRQYGGTGLGLAISKQLVEMMHGEIAVESQLGSGSVFTFTARFEKQLLAANPKAAARANLKDLRILIVDDNATNRKILTHQVRAWGMISAEAADGVTGLAMLRAAASGGEPFDLAILDLVMPNMDGFDLARIIKNDAAIDAVQLILMPSFSARAHELMAQQAGIAGCLVKPVRQCDLFDCLVDLISEKLNDQMQLDLAKPAKLQIEMITQQRLDELRTKRHEQILVAEDNVVNQKVVKLQLERLGYDVEVVENGVEALAALDQQSYSLVLMDCQMPKMDGYAATAEIRRREARFGKQNLPIIAVTAHAMQGEREKCLAAGMNDYLAKPFKQDELAIMINNWLTTQPESLESISVPIGEQSNLKQAKEGVASTTIADVTARLEEFQVEVGEEIANSIVELFLEDSSARLSVLQKAAEELDFAQLIRESHGLKGSGGNVGAKHLAHLCSEMEIQAGAKNAVEVAVLLAKIEAEMATLHNILSRSLKEIAA